MFDVVALVNLTLKNNKIKVGTVVLVVVERAHDGTLAIVRRQWRKADVGQRHRLVQRGTPHLQVLYRLLYAQHLYTHTHTHTHMHKSTLELRHIQR